MFSKNYSNFVRPNSPTKKLCSSNKRFKEVQSNTSLSGDEAKRLYLEEVNKSSDALPLSRSGHSSQSQSKLRTQPVNLKSEEQPEQHISDKDLFLAVQTDNVKATKDALNSHPDKINITDDYGWSLLMIACQANSIETVKELLKRGIETSIRDKAGNSAQSLVIRNKNLALADILIRHKRKKEEESNVKVQSKVRVKLKQFHCSICNQVYPNEQEHLSSTVHNINTSKGKKIIPNYAIPQTNKGYQIMLKVGWDKNSGLGPEGTGNKYPIKTVQKKDRKGLGHVGKKMEEPKEDSIKNKNRKLLLREYESNKQKEIHFRRQFY